MVDRPRTLHPDMFPSQSQLRQYSVYVRENVRVLFERFSKQKETVYPMTKPQFDAKLKE